MFKAFVVQDATIEPTPKFNIMGDKKSAERGGRFKVPVTMNPAVSKPVGKAQVKLVQIHD